MSTSDAEYVEFDQYPKTYGMESLESQLEWLKEARSRSDSKISEVEKK